MSYPSREGAKFDRAYYDSKHMPLVQEKWGPLGLTGFEVLYPTPGEQPFAAQTLVRFRDQAAIDAALTSPAAAEIIGDIPNFTNITAVILRAND